MSGFLYENHWGSPILCTAVLNGLMAEAEAEACMGPKAASNSRLYRYDIII